MTQELIVDLFAGGGGASTGIEQATGRHIYAAINHDPEALGMHAANHPHTKHYCADVFEVAPNEVAAGRPVGLLWASPDCKHFSKAKGGKPVDKKIRSLAWVVRNWAHDVQPRIIFVENVEEFKDWGPLIKINGKWVPDPKRKGTTFNRWVFCLRRLGYNVEWRELRACDYGAPTIRKRLFIIARRDSKPIVWPEPTHGNPKDPQTRAKGLRPWRTAAECIDWSLPCPSIFGRKKELSPNTLRRIARGIMKYVVNSPEPFIVSVNHGGDRFRGQTADEPVGTLTAKNGYGLVAPSVVSIANWSSDSIRPGDKPLSTVTANPKGGHHALVCATIATNTTGHSGAPADEPLRTVTTGRHHAVVTPVLAPFIAGNGGPAYSAKPVQADKPTGTITTVNHKCVVAPVLAQVGYGEAKDQQPRACTPEKPLWTVVSGGNHAALVTAFIAKHYTGAVGSGAKEPVGTVTSIDHNSVVASYITKLRGTNLGQKAEEPLHTISAQGKHFAEVGALLIKYYGNEKEGADLFAPAPTVTTKDRLGLVTVNIKGEPYVITDIGMRMLQPKELYAAQGFPEYYQYDHTADGTEINKSGQVRMCGNSVCPHVARALVKANYMED